MFRKKWSFDDIPDQSGRTVIVTGANSGIGFEAARLLALKNAAVILAVRDMDNGEQAVQSIRAASSAANVRAEILDLASLNSVRAFAERVNGEEKKLDLLINNAGVMFPPLTRTAEGFELQFGTNHLGHFALTALLFDRIASTVNSRIVNVSSLAHRRGKLDFGDLNWESREYNKTQAYCDSKLANLYFTYELGRKLEQGEHLTLATAAHPGYTATNLQKYMPMHTVLNFIFGQKQERGALPTLRAAVDPDATYGDYYGPDGIQEMGGYPKKVEAVALAHDREKAARLWEVSEEMTGIEFKIN